MADGKSALPEGSSHADSTACGSCDPIPVQDTVPGDDAVPAEQRAVEKPLTANNDVISAAQIVISYLWNTEHEKFGANPASHIMAQLRTLTRWLTSTPGD
ncbi:hypothetical protein [Nocardia salmonicida]|uniref:hypothetical protein n=1 Tax=Nocardia salmonicida TaxID=53431 RepID=UPI0033C40998